MTQQQAHDFITNLFKAWEARDAERLSNLYHKDVIAHLDGQDATYDDIMTRIEYTKKNFSQLKNNLKELIADETGKVAVRLEQLWTSKETGKTDVYQVNIIYHIKQNKVAELWATFYPNINYRGE